MGKKKAKDGGGIPAWLVTFSDLMTLLLTFFVLLVSMAVVDERRKLVALGSIIGTFGFGEQVENYLAEKDTRMVREPGPMDDDTPDLEMLKPPLWEDMRDDLRFEEDKSTRIVSVPADVLFASGSIRLSKRGRQVVDALAPIMKEAEHPVLLAGHVSTLRDEMGEDFIQAMASAQAPGPAWSMSLHRTLAVYQRFLDAGVPSDKMRVEAFGDARPRMHNMTAETRRFNRRVDIIIDKRSEATGQMLEGAMPEAEKPGNLDMDGFVFDLDRQAPAQPGPLH